MSKRQVSSCLVTAKRAQREEQGACCDTTRARKRGTLGRTRRPRTNQVYDVNTNPSSYVQSLDRPFHIYGRDCPGHVIASHFASLSVRYASRSNFGSSGSDITARMAWSAHLFEWGSSNSVESSSILYPRIALNARHPLSVAGRFPTSMRFQPTVHQKKIFTHEHPP